MAPPQRDKMSNVGDLSFPIVALGHVDATGAAGATRRLSPASRHFLALLVAAGPGGIASEELARERDEADPPSDQVIRMAATRLRKHLGDDVVPRADDGVYRLTVEPRDIDVWRLEEIQADKVDQLDLDEIEHLVRPVSPYQGVPPGELLDESERRIVRLQRDLLVRVVDSHPAAMSVRFGNALVAHAHADLMNEQLLGRAARYLAAAGRRSDAVRLFGRAHTAFVDAGLTLSTDLIALERELLDGNHPMGLPSVAVTRESRQEVPSQLRARITGRYVGQHRELDLVRKAIDDGNDGVSALVLAGRSGAGKTRLCAEAAMYASERAWAVMLLAPSTVGPQSPFTPLIAAMPELGEVVERYIGSADHDSARVAVWTAASEGLHVRRGGDRLLLIIDDAQWIDASTAEFLAHFATATIDGKVLVLLNGRRDVTQSAHWSELHDQMLATGADQIEVAPLDREGIQSFVDDLRPGMNGALLAAVASEVFERSAGLPGIAGPLLNAMPDGSAVLPVAPSAGQRTPVVAAIEQLSADARRVGVAAAVIGPTFRFDALQAISPLADSALFNGLDELLDRGLVLDQTLVDFEVAHALVERALLSSAGIGEVARAHQLAAEFYGDDVHRRAHHLSSALPLADIDEAVAALKQSAHISVSARSFRDAIRQFELVETLQPGTLTPDDLGVFSRALDLSGMHIAARTRRQIGFDSAAADGDWAAALEIATSGLPEVEPIEGDPAMAANLAHIDPSGLSAHDAWRHAAIAGKQLDLAGRVKEGMSFAKRSAELAATPTERVGSAIVLRVAMAGRSDPIERLRILTSVTDQLQFVSERLRGDFLLNLALDHHSCGDTTASVATVEQLEQVRGRSVVKVWQAQLMRAMHAADAGATNQAQTIRADAHAFAVNAGLGEADHALLAAMFVETWLAGNASMFAGEVDGGILDPSRNLVTKAAAAAVLDEVGEHERAGALASEVAEFVLAVPTPHTLVALAMVSAPLASAADSFVRKQVNWAFESVGHSMLVVGAGAANMGPASRYLARFAENDQRRDELLSQSLTFADRAGSLLWGTIARRDLIDVGHSHLIGELNALVADTQLANLAHPA